MRGLVSIVVLLIFSGCGPASTGEATADPESAATPDPPADSFEVSIINRCPEKWRYYVAAAESAGGDSAANSEVVPEDQYTFLEPGQPVTQRLRPGDLVWLVNRKGESTATGFQSKAEGDGGRLEVTQACDGVKRVRLAPAQP